MLSVGAERLSQDLTSDSTLLGDYLRAYIVRLKCAYLATKRFTACSLDTTIQIDTLPNLALILFNMLTHNPDLAGVSQSECYDVLISCFLAQLKPIYADYYARFHSISAPVGELVSIVQPLARIPSSSAMAPLPLPLPPLARSSGSGSSAAMALAPAPALPRTHPPTDQLFLSKCSVYAHRSVYNTNVNPHILALFRNYSACEPSYHPLENCIQHLRQLEHFDAPQAIVAALHDAVKMVYAEVETLVCLNGSRVPPERRLSPKDIGAIRLDGDTFSELWTYVLLQASPERYVSTMRFVEENLLPDALDGEHAYYLTVNDMAVNAVCAMTDAYFASCEVATFDDVYLLPYTREGYLNLLQQSREDVRHSYKTLDSQHLLHMSLRNACDVSDMDAFELYTGAPPPAPPFFSQPTAASQPSSSSLVESDMPDTPDTPAAESESGAARGAALLFAFGYVSFLVDVCLIDSAAIFKSVVLREEAVPHELLCLHSTTSPLALVPVRINSHLPVSSKKKIKKFIEDNHCMELLTTCVAPGHAASPLSDASSASSASSALDAFQDEPLGAGAGRYILKPYRPQADGAPGATVYKLPVTSLARSAAPLAQEVVESPRLAPHLPTRSLSANTSFDDYSGGNGGNGIGAGASASAGNDSGCGCRRPFSSGYTGRRRLFSNALREEGPLPDPHSVSSTPYDPVSETSCADAFHDACAGSLSLFNVGKLDLARMVEEPPGGSMELPLNRLHEGSGDSFPFILVDTTHGSDMNQSSEIGQVMVMLSLYGFVSALLVNRLSHPVLSLDNLLESLLTKEELAGMRAQASQCITKQSILRLLERAYKNQEYACLIVRSHLSHAYSVATGKVSAPIVGLSVILLNLLGFLGGGPAVRLHSDARVFLLDNGRLCSELPRCLHTMLQRVNTLLGVLPALPVQRAVFEGFDRLSVRSKIGDALPECEAVFEFVDSLLDRDVIAELLEDDISSIDYNAFLGLPRHIDDEDALAPYTKYFSPILHTILFRLLLFFAACLRYIHHRFSIKLSILTPTGFTQLSQIIGQFQTAYQLPISNIFDLGTAEMLVLETRKKYVTDSLRL